MEFRILGPLEVIDGDRSLPLGGHAQRALLAALLLRANEVVSTDRLLDALWPDEPPTSGATALQVRVSQLRKALGPAAARLETRVPGYVLRVSRDELDLDRFSRLLDEADEAEPAIAAERLREALALWRGPPLADLRYESFAQAAIGRIEELRLVAIERRIDADLALGRHGDAVGELESLVQSEPLRERLRAQLMLALYRSGRQADALQVFADARHLLLEELGLEPSPPLQELERAILRQDPHLQIEGAARAILVAARAEPSVLALLAFAEPLARRPPKELVVTRLVDRGADLPAASALLRDRRAALLEAGVSVRAAALVSRHPAADVLKIAAEQDVDLVLVDGPSGLLHDPNLAELLRSAPCDVAVLSGAEIGPGPVLVPFVGADHDWCAIELAAWTAGALDVPLIIVGPRERDRDASRLLASASLAVQLTLGVMAEPLLVEPGAPALIAAAETAGLVVVGLSERWELQGLGRVREALAREAAPPVVLVKRGIRPGGLAPLQSRTRFTWSLKA